MTTRQLPGFSILLTQYTLCKFILISTNFSHFSLHFLPRLPVFFSTTGLPILEKKWVSSQASTTPHLIRYQSLFFLVFSYHSFLFAGRNRTFYLSQARTTRTYPRANKIIPSIFGYLLPGTSIPYFFPLSPRRRKLSDCIS